MDFVHYVFKCYAFFKFFSEKNTHKKAKEPDITVFFEHYWINMAFKKLNKKTDLRFKSVFQYCKM